MKVDFSPHRDVTGKSGYYTALSDEPWLRLLCEPAKFSGRWIRLIYSSSLLEPLCRPLLRFVCGATYQDEILPGALLGRGIWIGFVPHGTTDILMSPTCHAGVFSFVIMRLEPLSTAQLVASAFQRNPRYCLAGLGAHIIGLKYTSLVQFRRALAATPLSQCADWSKARSRDFDIAHIDRPQSNWAIGPHIRFVVRTKEGDQNKLRAFLERLALQPYPHWSVALVVTEMTNTDHITLLGEDTARILLIAASDPAIDLLSALPGNALLAETDLAGALTDYALPALVEAVARDPSSIVFYGDEMFHDLAGITCALACKPDWSPNLFATRLYLGGTCFLRTHAALPWLNKVCANDFTIEGGLSQLPMGADRQVNHIRRVLISRPLPVPQYLQPKSVAHTDFAPSPFASIIIPTKNCLDLLRKCVTSLEKWTPAGAAEVIIVDNGSSTQAAREYLSALAQKPGFHVLSRPSPFNFSYLCNEGAAFAKGGALVFLNNDTEIRDSQWLENLLKWAMKPDIGAVGAKLLYPDLTLQHAGVALGIDGLAGHFERGLIASDPGYFQRLCVPHEVSAITGACLVVEKRKFETVGGFDATNLPVELNDIDLCLRLGEKGWQTLIAADTTLIHHESASRGTSLRPNVLYRQEHAYFRKKWIKKLRDEPYFHPALSLHWLGAALG